MRRHGATLSDTNDRMKAVHKNSLIVASCHSVSCRKAERHIVNQSTMRIEIFEHNLRIIAEKCKNCSNKIPPGRKKKRVREDKAVKVMKDVVEQLITAQQESDERFMRLEEKRIKLEEQQIQREECERS